MGLIRRKTGSSTVTTTQTQVVVPPPKRVKVTRIPKDRKARAPTNESKRRRGAASKRAERLRTFHKNMLNHLRNDNQTSFDRATAMAVVLWNDRTPIHVMQSNVAARAKELNGKAMTSAETAVAALEAAIAKGTSLNDLRAEITRAVSTSKNALRISQNMVAQANRDVSEMVDQHMTFRDQTCKVARDCVVDHGKYFAHIEMQMTMKNTSGNLTSSAK